MLKDVKPNTSDVFYASNAVILFLSIGSVLKFKKWTYKFLGFACFFLFLTYNQNNDEIFSMSGFKNHYN